MPNYFITGTDTGVGKTVATLALMAALQNQGKHVVGMKPVASGCQEIDGSLQNEDARQIQAQSSRPIKYDLVNPYPLQQPIAPHIAAEHAGIQISLDTIQIAYRKLSHSADQVIVEGIGGWCVPLGTNITTIDLVRRLNLPVILVIGLRLGCINHALLTSRAIVTEQMNLCAWIANQFDPDYQYPEATIKTLGQHLSAPLLGVLPYMQIPDLQKAAACMDIETLEKLK